MDNDEKQHLQIMEKNISDIVEILGFVRDNMATKDDLKAVENRLDQKIDRVHGELDQKIDRVHGELDQKIDRVHGELDQKIDQVHEELDQKIDQVRTEMLEHVDGFIGLHKDQEQETAALSARVGRLEKRMDAIPA